MNYIYFLYFSIINVATNITFFSVQLKSRKLFHSTYKLFVLSVVLQQFGIIQLLVAYLKFGMDGKGFPGLKTLGESKLVFNDTLQKLKLT